MPEELPAEPGGAVEPTETQDQPVAETDWQKRYTDTQSWGNGLNETITALKSDPDKLVEFLREHHPDMLVDPDAEEDDDDLVDLPDDEDQQPLTKAEWKAWQAQQDANTRATQAAQQFESDLTEFVGEERELGPQGRAFIEHSLAKGDFNGPKGNEALKKAVDGWFEYEDTLRGGKQRPRVPHTPTTGQTATGVPDYSKMSRGEINKAMVEQVLANEAQT